MEILQLIKAFEVGKKYWTKSLYDHECVWVFTVVRRTKKSVWITNDDDTCQTVQRKGISVYKGEEQCLPFGRYSMCPILGADREVKS